MSIPLPCSSCPAWRLISTLGALLCQGWGTEDVSRLGETLSILCTKSIVRLIIAVREPGNKCFISNIIVCCKTGSVVNELKIFNIVPSVKDKLMSLL